MEDGILLRQIRILARRNRELNALGIIHASRLEKTVCQRLRLLGWMPAGLNGGSKMDVVFGLGSVPHNGLGKKSHAIRQSARARKAMANCTGPKDMNFLIEMSHL